MSRPTGDTPLENPRRRWRPNLTLSYRLGSF